MNRIGKKAVFLTTVAALCAPTALRAEEPAYFEDRSSVQSTGSDDDARGYAAGEKPPKKKRQVVFGVRGYAEDDAATDTPPGPVDAPDDAGDESHGYAHSATPEKPKPVQQKPKPKKPDNRPIKPTHEQFAGPRGYAEDGEQDAQDYAEEDAADDGARGWSDGKGTKKHGNWHLRARDPSGQIKDKKPEATPKKPLRKSTAIGVRGYAEDGVQESEAMDTPPGPVEEPAPKDGTKGYAGGDAWNPASLTAPQPAASGNGRSEMFQRMDQKLEQERSGK